MMKPRLSYTIWFSQRTGSSLLCMALEATGIAGRPHEHFNFDTSLLEEYQLSDYGEIQQHLWEAGSTHNGIFGCKHSFSEPRFSRLIEELRQFPTCPSAQTNRTAIWEYAFPNHKHIFMTRRNKVRLAVSWWKAIQTQEWHLRPGQSHRAMDLSNSYNYEAINHLYNECSMREAGIQDFFAEGGIVPLNIFYEDFIEGYELTLRTILEYVDAGNQPAKIPPPPLAKTADEVSEEWVQRFREDRQKDWPNRGW